MQILDIPSTDVLFFPTLLENVIDDAELLILNITTMFYSITLHGVVAAKLCHWNKGGGVVRTILSVKHQLFINQRAKTDNK